MSQEKQSTGSQQQTIDCTPSWKAAATIYLTVVEQEASADRYGSAAMKNAEAGVYEMAAHLDAINKEKVQQAKHREHLRTKAADSNAAVIMSVNENFKFVDQRNSEIATDYAQFTVHMIADNSFVGYYDANNNQFNFSPDFWFTGSALQDLTDTGTIISMHFNS